MTCLQNKRNYLWFFKLTCEFREVAGYVRVHYLLLENVSLVEEQYDRGALEPGVGDDGFEQSFALLHTVLK